MTQFKDKAERRDFVSAGALHVPGPDGGDILLYRADLVPVGDDQRQHLELARDVAERFNARFGETFVVPRASPPRGRADHGPAGADVKMSTTGGTPQGTVLILDPPDVVRKKFKTAVTDSGREVRTRRREAGHLEPDRDPVGRDGRVVRRRSRRATTGRATGRSSTTSPRLSSRCSTRSGPLRGAPRRRGRARTGCSPSAPRRRGQRPRRRSRRCTSGWASSGCNPPFAARFCYIACLSHAVRFPLSIEGEGANDTQALVGRPCALALAVSSPSASRPRASARPGAVTHARGGVDVPAESPTERSSTSSSPSSTTSISSGTGQTSLRISSRCRTC